MGLSVWYMRLGYCVLGIMCSVFSLSQLTRTPANSSTKTEALERSQDQTLFCQSLER